MTLPRWIPRRITLGSESLESRKLLNAHSPRQPSAEVGELHAASSHGTKVPREISGTLKGVAFATLNPKNEGQGVDTLHATGSTQAGKATYIGTEAFSGVQVSPTNVRTTYFNGSVVLYLPKDSQIGINFSGNGPFPVSGKGPFSAKFKGVGIGINGPLMGQLYSFTETLTGVAGSDRVTIEFKLTAIRN